MSAARPVAAVVAAQVLVQVGAFFLPALLPGFIARWSLSAAEAGWLVGAFFAAYVPAVPVLVALTDRVPARRSRERRRARHPRGLSLCPRPSRAARFHLRWGQDTKVR